MTVMSGALSIGVYAAVAAYTGLARSDVATHILYGTATFAMILALAWALTSRMIRGIAAIIFVLASDVGIAVGLLCLAEPLLAISGCALFAITVSFACFFVSDFGFAFHLILTMIFVGWISMRSPPTSVTVISLSTVLWLTLGLPIVIRLLWTRSQSAAARAFLDPLTGVCNRAGIEHELQTIIDYADRNLLAIGVAVVDIDRFKSVNDVYGHHVGDLVIIETCRHLTAHFGPLSLVARSGGEEFVVLVVGYRAQVADSVRNLVPATPGEMGPKVTMSVGAVWYDNYLSALNPLSAAVFAADAAMYGVKAAGGNAQSSHLDTWPGSPVL